MVFVQKYMVLDASNGQFEVKDMPSEWLGPLDFGFNMNNDGDYFCFGAGILGGSMIAGTNRLIFTGDSPLWEGFYISTVGGAAEALAFTGVNNIAIKNKTDGYKVLVINYKDNKLSVRLEPVDFKKLISVGFAGKKGSFAVQQYIHDTYRKDFGNHFRVFAVGPAAQNSCMGAILSTAVVGGKMLDGVDGWAGRGGLGSKMLQEHGIIGAIYGGDFAIDAKWRDIKNLNVVFEKAMQQTMTQATTDATTKYRYDEAVKSGGTLGVNFTKLKNWLIYRNWDSVHDSEEKILKVHKEFIINHYVKQFNEETIIPKQQRTCGEVCPAVCKKMNKQYKKDYEPYEVMGPNSMIFDQRAAELLNGHCDMLGFDAIQIGTTIGWVMELMHEKLLTKEELGLTKNPKWDIDNFDVVNDSMHNAKLGMEILDLVMSEHELGKILRLNIRKAALELTKRFADRGDFKQFAMYVGHGDTGCITQNQYFVPGFSIGIPIAGKYFEGYDVTFRTPYELGKHSMERMTYEFYSDNTGICRFHRKWVEKAIQQVVGDLTGVNVDYYQHHKKLAKAIRDKYAKPVYWETSRVKEVIGSYLKKISLCEPENTEAKKLAEMFEHNTEDASVHYWQEALKGINDY